MAVLRAAENPIITPANIKPSRPDFEVIGAFNPAAVAYKDDVVLLVRVAERPFSADRDIEMTAIYDPQKDDIVIKEFSRLDPSIDFSDPRMTITPEGKFLTSLSHFRLATSCDGVNFTIGEKPVFRPANFYESFGVEDPRITKIGDTYYITYVAVSPVGVNTCLASTQDFEVFKRHGVIFCPDNKDVTLFPEKINGRYYAVSRPVTPLFEKYEMWIAESPDLLCWGNHKHLLSPSESDFDNARIGAGAPPIKIEQGWLEIYHGVDSSNRYCLGAILLDRDDPSNVIARTKEPVLSPQRDYETQGFFGNVVFSCGLVVKNESLVVYYGVADTSTACAEIPLCDILEKLS
ncbi:MAG: glycoside hydrolase family 130 protein [Phycisphaerae bacterium]|nr:glycoside hydrolase family 130 protein [Phycisphaerae bacterium]